MPFKLSLRHSWTAIILMAILIPSTLLMAWFEYQFYTTQLNSALKIEKQANEALRDQVESEFNRLKSVFLNKADPLSSLIDPTNNRHSFKAINQYLDFIIKREHAVQEIIILSKKATVLAAIDPNIGLTVGHSSSLTHDQLQQLKSHWGFNDANEPPEFVIPLFGRDYISSPKDHDGFMGFIYAIPIGNPVKAILIAHIDIDKLWRPQEENKDNIDLTFTQDYLLDRRGALLASTNQSKYKVCDLMTHLAITRTALANKAWEINTPYIGINQQAVFGTITTIPSLNWTLVSEVITSKITQPIRSKLIQASTFIVAGLMLFIWAILFLARKTIRPIQSICHATNHVAQGDFKVTLKPCGIKELDDLALDFNQMVIARKNAEEKLQLSSRVFRETHDAITITDSQARIIDVNPSFSKITGYSREDAIGRNPSFLSSGQQGPQFYSDMWQTIIQEDFWQGEVWNRKKNGEIYAELLSISTLKDENNNILHYVGVFSDITQNKQQQEKLTQMAHYDLLTQLPNRVLLADHFILALAQSKRQKTLLAVCFLDLDNFKPVNDLYGHETGDILLIEVAKRIKANIRTEDTVSRQGGDEFALLLGNIESFSQCELMLKRIIKSLAQTYIINGQSISIGASIGVTLYPLDNVDFDTLLRHADQAMYQAKLAGRDRYSLFNADQDQQSIKKTNQLEEIHQALSNNEICLYYQPKVNMKTGAVFGAEALIRWIHPEKGLIPPLNFLPVIEETELEIIIGDWVINEALKQLNSWKNQGIEIEVSVNISSYHLQSPAFITTLTNTLALYPKINSKCLQLEILESSALGDIQSISQIINNCIKMLGVNIALDDFGTGYSSLTHLRNLPVQVIKIDQSFVRDMLDDPNDSAIIDSVIGLADSFDRKVIAEGVETTQHGLMLLLMGCTEAQGYGIARPMPAADIPVWLDNYVPNQQWLVSAKKDGSQKENKIKIFQLTVNQWLSVFEKNILGQPDNIGQWPILKLSNCHCGLWIKRARNEHFFEEYWLIQLEAAHDDFHDLANDLLAKFQNGEIDQARYGLKKLQQTVEHMNSVLDQCE